MRKNPLLLLLGLSFVFFFLFLGFVYFVMQTILDDQSTPLQALKRSGRFGVIELSGVIMESKRFTQQIRRYEKDRGIRGIIIRIDSPGGAVGPSQEIYEAIKKVRATKPVVASLEGVAASGGYYAAVGAEKIISNPGTLTGSIGVIMNFANLAKLYEWAKMDRYILKSGKFKDIGSDLRDMTPEEKELMQTMLDDVHSQFIEAVAEGRKMPVNKVRALATGQIFTGKQAFNEKLVDTLGGLDKAVEVLKELTKTEGEPELVYPRPKRQSFVEGFLDPIGGRIAEGFLSRLGLSGVPIEKQKVLPSGLLYLAPSL